MGIDMRETISEAVREAAVLLRDNDMDGGAIATENLTRDEAAKLVPDRDLAAAVVDAMVLIRMISPKMSDYELLGLAANAIGRIYDRDDSPHQEEASELWNSIVELMNAIEDEGDGDGEDEGEVA